MKREESDQIFQLVTTMYDLHPERAAGLAPIWVSALERRDATATMDVLGRWADGRGMPEKMPPLGLFVAIVKSEERKAEPPSNDCPVCLDGWVEVGVRRWQYRGRMVDGCEQMAPCPNCDLGKLIEHPLEATGAWGPNGFWRGQDWAPVRPGVVETVNG